MTCIKKCNITQLYAVNIWVGRQQDKISVGGREVPKSQAQALTAGVSLLVVFYTAGSFIFSIIGA